MFDEMKAVEWHTCVFLMSAILNMNLRIPSRREMTAESDMNIVLARCFGWLMRANTMPSVTAFKRAAQMDCKATSHADSQQSLGDLTPYPDAATWHCQKGRFSVTQVSCKQSTVQ